MEKRSLWWLLFQNIPTFFECLDDIGLMTFFVLVVFYDTSDSYYQYYLILYSLVRYRLFWRDKQFLWYPDQRNLAVA